MRRSIPTLAFVGVLTAASVALAAGHAKTPREVVARKGLMNVTSINFGVVGDMARGKAEYDAEAAQTAAQSLLGVALIDQESLWPDATLGVEESRALAAIGEKREAFMAIWEEFDVAAANLQEVAGDGQEALGEAVGKLGATCKSCHDDYRQPQ